MKDEVVAKGVDGGDGTDTSVGEVESGAEGILEGGDGGVEEVGEKLAAFSKNPAQNPRDGEDKLAVRHVVADACGDPGTDATNPPLVAGGAEVATLAGEGEQFFMTTVRAVEACETGGEVAAAEKGLDGGYGACA